MSIRILMMMALGLGGCALLGLDGGTKKNKTYGGNDYHAAKEAGDIDTLRKMCMLQLKVSGAQVRRDACESAVETYIAKKDLATLKDICTLRNKGDAYEKWQYRSAACGAVSANRGDGQLKALDEADCGGIRKAFTDATEGLRAEAYKGKKLVNDRFANVGKRMAKCGHWAFLVEQVLHWGSNSKGMGYAGIAAIGEEYDWENQFFSYVKSKGSGPIFEGKLGKYFLGHYGAYLVATGKLKRCTDYIPVADRLSDYSFGALNWYFRQSNCKKAASIIAKRLTSERHATRAGVCKSLGQLGTKRKHKKKLMKLGKNDAYFWLKTKDKEGNRLLTPIKMYDVRTACMAAANRL